MLDNKKSVVLALGYFDCLHVGHLTVIERAKQVAKQLNAEPVVFTFDGDLRSAVNGNNQGSVYTLEERKTLLMELGVKNVYCAPVTKEFLSMTQKEFLDLLNAQYNVLAYCSGYDYRFGSKGLGDVKFLQDYANEKGQKYLITDTVNYDGEKIKKQGRNA